MDDIRLDLNNKKIQSDKNAHTEWSRQETDKVKIIKELLAYQDTEPLLLVPHMLF